MVTGDVHVGDVHHSTQNTHVDQSTNVELPSLDEVGEKVSKAAKNVFDFVKGPLCTSFVSEGFTWVV